MSRTGYAHLPLHTGRAPRWLFERMVPLSREIVVFLASEFGREEVLRRLADPYWFQAFGCVLGFDWHSSGLTTTVCGALKEGLRGNRGRARPLRRRRQRRGLAQDARGDRRRVRAHGKRPGAAGPREPDLGKVDNSAVQDGYQLYHHSFVFTARGEWCIVQQGMSDETSMARRYHWISEGLTSYVNEPHAAVCCDATSETLNLVAAESAGVRSASATLASQKPEATLLEMVRRHDVRLTDINPKYLHKILLRTYEAAPRDFEQLLGIEGVGAKTLRALALTSELVYGTAASHRDPARYAFAHGGKDGTPFPVERATYDKTIEVMGKALNAVRMDRSDKVAAFRRLARFAG